MLVENVEGLDDTVHDERKKREIGNGSEGFGDGGPLACGLLAVGQSITQRWARDSARPGTVCS